MAKDRVDNDIGTTEHDWQSVKRRVQNLKRRIFRATKNGEWNQVRSLMKLMLRSYANLLLSVHKITQENKGKRTPGIDRQIVRTPKARARLIRELLIVKAWKVKPAVRIYIPKADGKQRPLGILTIKNRVAQPIVKNAIEPFLRHVKVKGSASPFDPDLVQYWNARFERQHRKLANPGSLDYAVRMMLRA